SNDAWFGDRAPARLHLDIASLRAIENRRYLLRATATGLSAVIDPYGRTLTESRLPEPEVAAPTLRPSEPPTPDQPWGDPVACATAPTACGVTTPLAATLVVSVEDDPPCDNDQTLACGVDNPDANCPGLTSTKGTTTVTLTGRRRKNRTLDKGGRPFTLSQT